MAVSKFVQRKVEEERSRSSSADMPGKGTVSPFVQMKAEQEKARQQYADELRPLLVKQHSAAMSQRAKGGSFGGSTGGNRYTQGFSGKRWSTHNEGERIAELLLGSQNGGKKEPEPLSWRDIAASYAGGGDSSLPANNTTAAIKGIRQNEESIRKDIANREKIEQRKAERQREFAALSRVHPWITSAASVGSSMLGGTDLLQQLVDMNAVGESIPRENLSPSEATETIRGGVSQNMGTVGKLLYGTVMSGVDSVTAGALGGGVPFVGGGILAGNAASSAMNDIKARGGSDQQAVIGGVASGVFEALFENLSIGQLDALKELPVDSAKTLFQNLVKSMVTNASEEAATELANTIFDSLYMKELSSYSSAVKRYLTDGASEAEARGRAKKDAALQIAESALSGALMGVGMGAVGSGIGALNNGTWQNSSHLNVQEAATAPGDTRISPETETPAAGRETAHGGAVNENGLTALTEQERVNLSSGKRNKVVETFREAVDFVRNALSNKQTSERAYLGKVPDATARLVFNETGIDITGYNAVLSGENVRHIIRRHGGTAETLRGQGAVTEEDIARIPEIISEPDRVRISDKPDARGRTALIFEKRFGDNYITVQAVSDGTHSIQTDTLFKQIKKNPQGTEYYDTGRDAGPAHNVQNVPPQGSSEFTIPQRDGAVNGEPGSRAELYTRRLERRGVAPVQAEQMGMWLAEIERGGQLTAVQEQMIEGEPEARALLEFLRGRNDTQTENGGILNGQETGAQPQSGGNDLYGGDGGRVPGIRTGGEAGGLAGAAEGRINTDQLRTASERQNRVHALRPEPVSTRELGLTTGTEEATVMLVPREAYDTQLKTVERSFQAAGYQVSFVIGQLRADTRGGTIRVSGAVQGDQVYIRADDPNWTVDQIASHERFHIEAVRDPGLVSRVREKILSRFSEEQFNRVVETYIQKLRGIIDIPENGTQAERDEALLGILEEIFADAYGDKNTFTPETSQYTEVVRETIRERSGARPQETAAATERTTGPPSERYSYAGDVSGLNTPESYATIETNQLNKGEISNERYQAAEAREAFLERCVQARYQVEEAGETVYGYRPVHLRSAQQNARSVQEELNRLGVPCFIHDGEIEANKDGRTFRHDTREAATLDKSVVGISNTVSLPARNVAGHEAFHYWSRGVQGQEYAELLLDNLDFSSEDVRYYAGIVQEDHFGGKIDLSDDMQRARYLEELCAYLSGDIHEGAHEAELRRMFRDYDAVKAAWESLAEKTKEAGITPSPAASDPEGLVLSTPASKASIADIISLVKDDAGSLIPLSERYDPNNADPRYSAEGGERRKTARDTLRQKLEEMFPAGKGSKREMNTLIRDVIDGGGTSLSAQERMDRAFNTLLETARVQNAVNSDAAEVAGDLRGRRIYVPEEVKAEFGDDWNSVRRQAMGAGIYLVNDSGAPGVDMVFAELSARFAGPFAEGVTDRAAMIETMLQTARNGRGEEITLLEEARRLGGEGSEDAFRTAYRSMFDTAVEAYRTELLNISAEEKTQRLAELDRQEAKLREYIENARETLRQRAVDTGEAVPAQALGTDSTGKPRSIDDYLAEKASEAEAARTRRLRNIPKTEFEGTENLRKIGVRIEGTVTDYWGAESMRKSEASLRLIRNEIKRAEKRLRATPAEKKFASDMVAGVYTLEYIPAKMDRETVMELADYYMAERAMDTGMIRQKKRDISRLLDERMAALFKDSDRYKPSSAAVLNHRTPQRNMLKIFGDRQGRIINEAIFDPVSVNEAERIRWTNRQFDQVRTFTGRDGKASALNKAERAAVQNTIEGKALEEMLAGMELGESIKRVGENIRNNPDSPQNFAWEFALRPSEEKLAQRYARWLETKEALDSGALDSVKVENAAMKYTQMFDDYYEAINDFLVSHGYDPIGFIKGYAPHLQPEEAANLLDKALRSLGVNTDVTTLPTAIAGQTADFKPGKKWNPYFLTRQTDIAQADIVAGFESYVQYLGEVLYHTDDIMRVRRMSEHIRKTYAPEEIRVAIEQAEYIRWRSTAEKEAFLRDCGELPRGKSVTPEQVSEMVEDYITRQFKAIDEKKKYGTLVPWLDNYANILAGKQSLADRGSEYGMGRGILNVGNRLTRIFARAQVAGNLSSALNQTSQLPQIIAENGAVNTAEALRDMITGNLRKAGFAQESDLLTGKDGIHFIVYTPGDMVMNVLFTPAGWADTMVSTLAVRGAYLKAVKSGMSHQAAMKAADSFAANIMGSRAKGSRPLAFESKNPVSQMAHVFQLEVLNSWEHLSQDLPRDFREIQQTYGKDKAVAALAGVIVKALLSAFVLNRLSEELYGGTPAPFDLLGLTSNFIASGQSLTTNQWIRTVLDNGLEELTGRRLFRTEDTDSGGFDVGAAFGELGRNISNDLPFVRNISGLMGWGDQTLPWPDIYGGVSDVGKAAAADGLFSGRTAEELFDLAAQLIPGGRQISKTVKGAATMARGGRVYGWGDKARLQYPVEASPFKWGQAVLFGTNALEESREYWLDGGEGGLSAKQTARWKALMGNGANGQEAFDAIKEVSEAEGWLAKVREIAEAPWNDDMKEMLLEDSISETQYKRWRAAQKAGVKLIAYTDFLDRAYREARKRTGEDSASPSQEDVEKALESAKLTDRQRTAIWNSYGWKRESPWG